MEKLTETGSHTKYLESTSPSQSHKNENEWESSVNVWALMHPLQAVSKVLIDAHDQ